MSEYINLDINFADHIKFVRLVHKLGRGSEILPIRLWCYCGKYHSENGRLTGYSPLEIETTVLKWWGRSGEAIEAMIELRFLQKEGKDYVAHDWKAINGHIEAFHERAVKAAKARWGKIRGDASSNANGNAQAMPEQCPTDLPTLPPNERTNDLLSPGAKELAELLKLRVLANDPRARMPKSLEGWIDEADKLLRIDQRPLEEAQTVLAWCQSDGFWRGNILSMGKFRDKYTALKLKMETLKNGGKSNAGEAKPKPGKYASLGSGDVVESIGIGEVKADAGN